MSVVEKKEPTVERERALSEQPLFAVLTRMLIRSFCPFMKSEIFFGAPEPVKAGTTFALWIEQPVHGELEGKLAVGGDAGSFRVLAHNLGIRDAKGEPDPRAALAAVQARLAEGFTQLCREQNFDCRLSPPCEEKQSFVLSDPGPESILCPVESKFGNLKVFFSLAPQADELLQEWEKLATSEPRKIRVYASQLESVFDYVKEMEILEQRWNEGPHIRTQIRSRIKRLKRSVLHLKSESLETLFSPARKLAAEIAKQQGKQVGLTSQGTSLFLDKGLLNFLYEPILHLIRNAVDHGIEEPSERERLGKPAAGHIKCIAGFSERGLRLIVSDDGQGFDIPKIRARAVAKGLIARERAEQMLSSDLYPLVFEAGFSTRERADAISGRGLGLDIVKKGIDALGGSLRILSTSGHGTAFEIFLPLNDDLTGATRGAALEPLPREQEERLLLLDELSGYFERLFRALSAFKEERLISAAYESFRLVHTIKGTVAFLGWGQVASFCHHYEELLKLIAEEKSPIDSPILDLVMEVANKLREFTDASRNQVAYPLLEIRRLEAKVLQAVWAVTHSEEHGHFFFGKYHLSSVESLFSARGADSFRARPETQFQQAIGQPFGALIQFSGDRRGYAGLLLPENTFQSAIHPFVAGAPENVPVKAKLWALGEFASLMGSKLSELAAKAGLSLQASAPLTYYGWGEPLKILGTPTYCYACEIEGSPFYLAGDFRNPLEEMERLQLSEKVTFHPSQIMEEAKRQCTKHLQRWNLPIAFQEISTQSDLVGFDGGITVIISCVSPAEGGAQSILFMSYEATLAQHMHLCFTDGQGAKSDQLDLYDCLNETSNIIGGLLVAELEKKKLRFRLSLPTLFQGKAYVANFNRLYVTNKWVGSTPHGKLEMQILVTQQPG